MTIQSNTRLTAAETALVEAYTTQLSDLPGDPDVLGVRDRLLDDLKTGGLPTRRIESWHYTDLKALLKGIPAFEATKSAKTLLPLVGGSTVLPLLQGKAAAVKADDFAVTSYAESLTDGSAAERLNAASFDDAIGRINASFVRDGFVLDIPAEAEIETPIEIQSVHAGGQVHTRIPVTIGAGAKVTVIERHIAAGEEDAAFVSSVSDVTIGEGAEVTWVVLQQQGAADTFFGQIRVDLGADAKLKLFDINAGGKLVRQELRIDTTGEGAELTLRGVNLIGGEQHNDVTLVLGHNVPNTSSTDIFRNVVFDRGRGVFQGMIKVAQDAQKTDAKMSCNTLLLSDDADFAAKPELEIFADDVVCGHGATVADIDDNHLYYLKARGIPENKARAMLVNAFVAEVVEELEEEPLVEALEQIISAWLEKHA
ncbi:Fe-S cluster assembly protein SufD [Rhizobiaceae bacterium BDR2-2]|uniref:Fe-S cluster assembly protein SufD n=1 Tax=Ectorhizobium quercum TaxID=2965071 RepID=A0AAE3SWV0_9HYPH|nr:Fe-S cluster assembly protein SufD [Ectorhizobium quercum]MCX8997795.1 Fe-S cluster assembly protein SufD [Ectorhizobium quercum]